MMRSAGRSFLKLVVLCMIASVAAPARAGLGDLWRKVKDTSASAYNRCADYCQKKVDKARADQAKNWGLKLPANFNPDKPLTILIHGLDSNQGIWNSMNRLLVEQQFQIGFFNFPSNAEIEKSTEMLADAMAELHKAHPRLRVNFLTHSMGGIVARSYIEGGRYSQPIDRFIALAPPNHGSNWARFHLPLKLNEQYWLWKYNKDWSPLWAFTDGSGGAKELLPGSPFLNALNARPRRDGVQYTIIVGSQHICWRKTANAVDVVESFLPEKTWGLAQSRQGLENVEGWLREQSGAGDGAVSLESARLDGVKDILTLQADHSSMVMGIGNAPPVAWDAIRERLSK